ncbi:SRPBCC domain-containing protein [Echinicola sp. CAU 1574]|uniref:SRPBCC domain-containing protein n=1 Tax=Echinicola arenosa TaxID=2774144 RepID=A0ABR9AFC9_9BACT|nr:SRPBCC domain-containing protein [Echinicola arenosa]MBD8487402.1 SRPBCC domain-containing protein [Echinicola arenosa]
MEKLTFTIQINTSPEKVWETLWDDKSYQAWTAVFSEGSRAETDWKEGSKVLFLDGNGQGMVSRIAKTIPNKYMSIEHLGFYDNGKEDLESEKVKSWAGVHENYTLKNIDGNTELLVEMDTVEEYKEYFNDTWPKALLKLKSIAED